MGKLKNKLYRFMYGRYGMDKLGNCMMIAYVVLLLVYTVLTFFITQVWFDLIVWLVSIALFITVFYRMLSRNISKRRKENERFCGFFTLRKNKFKDRKTHVYKKCPKCKAVLRLPKRKGTNTASCPRCKHKFEVKG